MKICVYCGSEATTSDHVPPKVCFGSPYPANLITVPACTSCNNRFSEKDEEFASYLSLRVGMEEPAALRLHQKNRRIVARNARIRRAIIQKTKIAWVKNGGIIVGQSPVFHWDGPVHDEMIVRIVRGLYYRAFKQALPSTVPVKGSFQRPFVGALLENWQSWGGENIGKEGEFCYRYAFDLEQPTNSLWMITFYNRHFASAKTGILVEEKVANQAALQTPTSVTPAANAPVAPPPGAAGL